MLSVEEATNRILQAFLPIGCETVTLPQALGRVLAEPVIARLTQPPFRVSAMDGYAVRASDVTSLPRTLRITMRIAAGQTPEGSIGPGEAARIFTGAPLPEGADTIVIQEDCNSSGQEVVVKAGTYPLGRYVRGVGLDFREGEIGIHPGKILNARDLGLAAAMDWPWLTVRRRPRIAILATGDELSYPGERRNPSQIVASNSIALAALVREAGGEALDLGIARDNESDLARAIESAHGCDLLVTSGGASVGEHDLVQSVLAKKGMELDFWKIAMRPGKPLLFGRLGDMKVLGMPGNPVSATVTSVLFLQPAIRRMLGIENPSPFTKRAILGSALPANDFRQDYLRARLVEEKGTLVAYPFERQDSSMLSLITKADCLVIRKPNAPAANPSEEIEMILLSPNYFDIEKQT